MNSGCTGKQRVEGLEPVGRLETKGGPMSTEEVQAELEKALKAQRPTTRPKAK